jgi:two-component sensor histidine kinase
MDDLYRLLRNAHTQAQGVVDTVRDPLLVLDAHLCVVSANRAFFETFRVGRDETIGRPFHQLGDGRWDIEELRLLLETVVPRSASIVDYEVRADFPEIGRRTMLVSAHRLVHPDSHSRVLLLSIVDATERRRRDEEKDVLIGELSHRIRNLFSVVAALARRTQVTDRSAEEYRDAFLGRFEALMRAHELMNSAPAAPLGDLVRTATEPYAAAAFRVEEGPAVALTSERVLPVSLILHELATNALKHGALSAPQGRVRLGWALAGNGSDDRRLTLRWKEEGGPAVSPPPTRGFGGRLIAFSAERDLGGQVKQNYAPEGLEVEVTFPL